MGKVPATRRAEGLAAKQHGAIARRQALAAGLTPKAIRVKVRSGRWSTAENGVYTVTGAPATFRQRLMVAVLGEPGGVVSHLAAGVLWGIVEEQPARVDVTVPHARHDGSRPGKLVHRARSLGRSDVRRIDSIPVTCPQRTLVDLAGLLARGKLEHALDTALNRGLVSIRSLERYIADRHLGSLKGMGRLRRLLDERKHGVYGSGLERAFRRVVGDFGLPEPVRQFKVGRRRIDFAYPDARIAIELDDVWTHGTARALRDDLRRQNELVLAGWLPVRFTREDVYEHPEHVARTLETARRRRAREGA